VNLKSPLFSITVALLCGLAFPATAAPYLVYQGTISQSSDVLSTECTAVRTELTTVPSGTVTNPDYTHFHQLNTTLQEEIGDALIDNGGSSDTTFYLIVDEQNTANYTFVLLDPTATGKRIASIESSNLPAAEVPENLLGGFGFSARYGLGVFRLGIIHSTGKDPVTGAPGSFLLQGYAIDPLYTTANAQLAPKRAAETFYTTVNGVKGAEHTIAAAAAILSPSGAGYMPTIEGTLFGYYFDSASAQTIGGASTAGRFALTISAPLTQLANNGGEYEPSTRNIGLVTPISASTTAAYTAWAQSLIAIASPPTN
jgi:hypothetical protein